MKKILAIFVALVAAISGVLALDAHMPDEVEKMGPGTEYTYGDYSTLRTLTEDGIFTPQTLNSQLKFTSGDVSANVDQTVATSIDGTPEGITRQLLMQSASAYVAKNPTIPIDAQVDGQKTTLIMNIEKDQSAFFSGKMVSTIASELTEGVDAPFDGTGADDMLNPVLPANPPPGVYNKGYDDQYGGGHQLAWLDLTGNPASWTATFNDQASLTAMDANKESVTLKESVVNAKVTVSAEARDPEIEETNVISIIDPLCSGFGDLWTLNPDGTTDYIGPGTLVAEDYDGTAQLTEAAASISSSVTLTDREVQILGGVIDIRTMDGFGGLEGGFADALLTEDSIMNVDVDGDFDFSWTNP